MKTVMKKMFCLMLVAVLLVGALPFQASAAEITHTQVLTETGTLNVDALKNYYFPSIASTNYWVHCESPAEDYVDGTSFDTVAGRTYTLYVVETVGLCSQCGAIEHGSSVCCTTCNGYGHTPAAAHCDVCHYEASHGHATSCIKGCTGLVTCPQTTHNTGCLKTVICGTCGTVGGTHTPECDALCNGEVNCSTTYGHKTGCKSQIVCAACGKVGGTHYDTCLEPCTVSAECTSKTHKYNCPAPCTCNATCTSNVHKPGCTSLDLCTYCGQKGHVTTACPNYYYSCGCLKASGHAATCTAVKWTVTFNPNYNVTPATTVNNVVNGTKLYDVYTPKRSGYTFEAWYTDANLTNMLSKDTTVTAPMTVYAKWKQIAPYNVSVIIYTNGNKTTPSVTLDLYSWAQDGVITLQDVKDAVAKAGIKANNNVGLSIYGPYTPSQWVSYVSHDYYRNATEKVAINSNEATVLYAMVHNVLITKGKTDLYGSIADKTNPKTGDAIYMPVAVLGLSTSALAVMFYLNKKKRVM